MSHEAQGERRRWLPVLVATAAAMGAWALHLVVGWATAPLACRFGPLHLHLASALATGVVVASLIGVWWWARRDGEVGRLLGFVGVVLAALSLAAVLGGWAMILFIDPCLGNGFTVV